MFRVLCALVACIVADYGANALPNGPPSSACGDLMPRGPHTRAVSQALNFVINAPDSFNPGSVISITVQKTGETFRGLLMQVRNDQGNVRGSFTSVPANFRIQPCPASVQPLPTLGTVSHRNRLDKPSATFQWQAPASCEGQDYTIRATVVQSTLIFETGITKIMRCIDQSITTPTAMPITQSTAMPSPEPTAMPTEPTATSMEPIAMPTEPMPIPDERQCQASNTSDNSKYMTSFEGHPYVLTGWINEAVDREGTGWRRHSGGTQSRGTGPSEAAQGRYYMYYETSRPRSEGDKVVLRTETDLIGCFCFSLKLHFNVDNVTGHNFAIVAGGEEIFSTDQQSNVWTELEFQFDTEEFFDIQLIGTRGRNFRGDMAIDDIEFEEGLCEEEDDSDCEGDDCDETDGSDDEDDS